MVKPSLRTEKQLWKKGFQFVAGVDEAGRGPLAGPVVAAAVILPQNFKLSILRDSKLLSPSRRLHCYYWIQKKALAVSSSVVSHKTIDRINILRASLLAMRGAIAGLDFTPDYILIDGRDNIAADIPQRPIIKGDATVFSIAAASVVAKVVRDNIMFEYHRAYPEYGFARHKGYGTKEHLAQIKKHGPSPVHRKSFGPLTGIRKVAKIPNRENKRGG